MGRQPQTGRLEKMYGAVEQNPGRKAGYIARLLDHPRSMLSRMLPSMEVQGYLLSEDDNGGLRPYRRENRWVGDWKMLQTAHSQTVQAVQRVALNLWR